MISQRRVRIAALVILANAAAALQFLPSAQACVDECEKPKFLCMAVSTCLQMSLQQKQTLCQLNARPSCYAKCAFDCVAVAPNGPCKGAPAIQCNYKSSLPAPCPFVPPAQVRVDYTMFIPLDHVRLPSYLQPSPAIFFAGDNKASHIPGETSFRIRQVVTWTRSTNSLASSAQSGLTTEYPEATGLSTTLTCYRKNCGCPTYPLVFESIVHEGKCKTGSPTRSGFAGGMDTIVASIVSQTSTSIQIRFSGEPFNTLEPISEFFGDIDWSHTLTIDWSSNPTRYTLQYQHDGFPFHDIRINATLVRAFDPVPNGQTPLSLNGTGSGEWSGTISGTL